MPSYFVRLIPPRKTFAQDMTGDERAVMGEHATYWAGKHAAKVVLAYGPVIDAQEGGWGLGIVHAQDEEELRAFEAGDPAILSGRGFRYEHLQFAKLIY